MNTHATEDFFAGCVNTHREIHEHTGKFIISLSVLEYSQENSRHTQGKWITRWIQMNNTCIVGLPSFNSRLKLVLVFLPHINSQFDDSFFWIFLKSWKKNINYYFLNIFIWLFSSTEIESRKICFFTKIGNVNSYFLMLCWK